MGEEIISTRSWLHRYADLIDDEDLPEVKMVMQQYAARAMNKKYMEEHKNEEAQ
jgi:hypothetical protein